MTIAEPTPSGHSFERLKAYLADELSREERAEVEDHLADCEACRKRLVELHLEPDELEMASPPAEPWLHRARDLGAQTPPHGWLWPLAAGLTATVLGSGLWLLWDQTPTAEVEPDVGAQVFRAADTVQPLELLSPAEDALLPRASVDLRWTPVVGAIRYRVVMLDLSGAPIAEHRTDQPHWLWPGRTDDGFWYVEAELADGSRIESEPRRLAFAPSDSTDSQPQ